MDIFTHPIWTQIAPTTKKSILFFKRPFHLGRFYLAKSFASAFKRKMFVGVTGSAGKTTTVAACKLVLSQKYKNLFRSPSENSLGLARRTLPFDFSKGKVLSTTPNLDPILNIPKTILKITPFTKKVILEMGIEYPGEMEIYLNLVKPATAIVTTIALQHSEFLGDVKAIAEQKAKLVFQLPRTGVAILNWDDPEARKMADLTKAEVIFFGTNGKNCHVWASNIKIENFRTTFEINYGVEKVKIDYPLLGIHQIYPALAAASLGLSEGLNLSVIKKALEEMEPQEHRLMVLEGHGGSVILDDSYNGSPISVEAALDTLQRVSARRRIAVLGETKELGKFSEEAHRQIGRILCRDRVDLVLLGRGEANIIADELLRLGFPEDRIEYNLANNQIIRRLLKILEKGDVCLIKGSRSLRLDEVVERVAKKRSSN